jgi:acyl-CoA synthetase (AMP-forming)/AMP-acid ligase II
LGLPDKTYGDAVCAIIVPEEAAKRKQEESSKPAISLEELCEWAKDKLAPYKVLQQTSFISHISKEIFGVSICWRNSLFGHGRNMWVFIWNDEKLKSH